MKQRPRDEALRQALRDATYAYALDCLREDGGTTVEAIHRADIAIMARWSDPIDEDIERRLRVDIERIQADVTARICSGGRWWIRGGPGRRWHRVATPTRALCGAAINSDDKAWALSAERPEDPVDWGHRDYDPGNAGRCTGCDKR